MKRLASIGLVVAALAGSALAAGGAEGEHGGGSSQLVWQAVNLLLLLGVLFFLARKPIVAFFAERRELIGGEIDSAASVLADAEARFAEWQRKLVELDGELAEIRETARERARHEREQILAEAQEMAERIQSDATASIEQELRRAKGDLRREAAQLAAQLAEQILEGQINDADRDRLLDEFISGVEHAGPADASGMGS